MALGSYVHETELGVPGRKQGWGGRGGYEGTVSHSLSTHDGSCALLLVSQAFVKVPACLFCTKDYWLALNFGL